MILKGVILQDPGIPFSITMIPSFTSVDTRAEVSYQWWQICEHECVKKACCFVKEQRHLPTFGRADAAVAAKRARLFSPCASEHTARSRRIVVLLQHTSSPETNSRRIGAYSESRWTPPTISRLLSPLNCGSLGSTKPAAQHQMVQAGF